MGAPSRTPIHASFVSGSKPSARLNPAFIPVESLERSSLNRSLASRDKILLCPAILLIALQCAALVFISIKTAVNIPLEDDYAGILRFLRQYASLHNTSARAAWVLTAQHTNYKLILLHALIAAQYTLHGHVNLRSLDLIGDASLLLSAALLWCFVCRVAKGPLQRVWLYVPVGLLFLSPIYWRNMNWALCAVQNLSIVAFALASFLCLAYRGRIPAVLLLISITLAVATSGNGLFVPLIVLGMLILQRRMPLAAVVLALTIVLAAVYAVHYHVSQVGPPLSWRQTALAIVLIPVLFLGDASGAHPAVFGIAALVIFVWLLSRRWDKADPAAFATASFCIVTALGVTATRHRYGWVVGVYDRYNIYSLLLIVCEILGLWKLAWPIAQKQPGSKRDPIPAAVVSLRSGRAAVLVVLVLVAVLHAVRSDRLAYRSLEAREAFLKIHLIEWQRSPASIVLLPDEAWHMKLPEWVAARTNFQAECAQDIALGLYIPPTTASDPLPARPSFVP